MTDARLRQNDPVTQHLFDALAGKKKSLDWLAANRKGLYVFARALNGGGKQAIECLQSLTAAEWDEFLDLFVNDDLSPGLEAKHPEIQLLFEAVKGDDESFRQLKRKKPALGKLAACVREYQERLVRQNEASEAPTFPGDAAADVGCLIGEMHLGQGEYHKAIEAFTRAVENQPSADVYEGRAKAYRALAQLDEDMARELSAANH